MDCKRELKKIQDFCRETNLPSPGSCSKIDCSVWFFKLVIELEEKTVSKIIKSAF